MINYAENRVNSVTQTVFNNFSIASEVKNMQLTSGSLSMKGDLKLHLNFPLIGSKD